MKKNDIIILDRWLSLFSNNSTCIYYQSI
jgi:hypothetical protein